MPAKKFKSTELTPEQIRAARQLVGWRAEDLADKSGIHVVTIRRTEIGQTDLKPETAERIVKTFEKAGVVFLGNDGRWGPGVRRRN